MILDNDACGGSTSLDEDVDPDETLKIIEKHGGERSALVSILGDIQARYRYLPADALRLVADRTGCSLVDVYGAATFYRSFSLKPKGKHLICACLGTACHVRGAPRIAEEFQRQLGIGAGETTPDKEFTLETVNCLGACALGPVVVIDGRYFSKVRKSQVKRLIGGALEGFDKTEIERDQRVIPIDASCPLCNHSLMDEGCVIDGRAAIRLTASINGKSGWALVSSLYGSDSVSVEHDIPADTVVSLLCPHCRVELVGPWECPACGAPMARMSVRGGGTAHICTRRGCKSRMLDLT